MNEAPRRIVYFNRMAHEDGRARLAATPGVTLKRLDWDAPEATNWPVLAAAHGYQISSARQELPACYRAAAPLLARCPALLAVSADGAGFDTVDLEACTRAGVIVVNQAGGNREAVAEHALAMMLCLSKRLIESDRALRRDRNWHRNDFLGNDLLGKTLGIIGLGQIGGRLAALCGLLEMRVVAYDPYLDDAQFAERGAAPVTLDALLAESDFVSVSCPLTEETANMIDARALARMKPGAYFITTARGGIHDEDALAAALGAGVIRGAGLDVWVHEPPALDHPLLAFDNVILSPHIAGVTEESRRQISLYAADQWAAIWRGARPERLLNPEAWPRFRARHAEAFR
ncbi:MAG: NAD(P)-dependent oxidoreductase [Alphaproteobacteria bacterium]|jgi:D-3-phosphoglycerate dehydrogenase|nr:NAD(P)-dependent oxidoreductase [Alphaproteobacteria bacterium]